MIQRADPIGMNATAIHELMRHMQTADPEFHISGAEFHHYQFGPARTDLELLEFEVQYEIELPEDYRRFLMEVGDGGAKRRQDGCLGPGPHYGIQPLREQFFYCDPSIPFPLMQSGQTVPGWEDWGGEESSPYPGLVEIGFQGAAPLFYLVVNGPAYGTVWELAWDKPELVAPSFSVWYATWLKRLIEWQLPRRQRGNRIRGFAIGATKEDLIALYGDGWEQKPFYEDRTFLSFQDVPTTFVLNEKSIVILTMNHRPVKN